MSLSYFISGGLGGVGTGIDIFWLRAKVVQLSHTNGFHDHSIKAVGHASARRPGGRRGAGRWSVGVRPLKKVEICEMVA